MKAFAKLRGLIDTRASQQVSQSGLLSFILLWEVVALDA